VIVGREFLWTSPTGTPTVPWHVDAWQKALEYGTQVRSPEASIHVIQFVDFQCPYCQRFHNLVLRDVVRRSDVPLGMILVHFPLSNHPLALPLAHGFECAARQGPLLAYVDAVFEIMPSGLDDATWLQIAREADLPDPDALVACVLAGDADVQRRIEAGKSLGLEWGVRTTPTVMVNGWRFPRPPSATELDRVIDALGSGRDPF
jgi:protein-disulfide isomerase